MIFQIIRTAGFLGLGFTLGKLKSSQRYEKTISKIVNANYLDDEQKVALLQDLDGKLKANKVLKPHEKKAITFNKKVAKQRLKKSLGNAKKLLKL
ncbi:MULTISPECIES: hypothetical protein [Lactobacillus]|uniref:Uncharacterized protein n=1 Tax=Lactobacillus xujianguonis TaxID=2495899 RepID=A0A437STY7_9LACO|nr:MULTISPECIES: hypothetical protein [Lactobacillus]RVU70409.1 hypothetical protein EJK17_07805 [Lactobacillus xujianguonis]RVU73656.1 hypothetical protein EJK20_07130 [Lactobacillus xujianguonis]